MEEQILQVSIEHVVLLCEKMFHIVCILYTDGSILFVQINTFDQNDMNWLHFRENILHIPNYGITIMLIPKLGSLLLDKPFKVHNEHILLRVVRYQAYTKYSQRVSSFMYYIDASLIGWMKIL